MAWLFVLGLAVIAVLVVTGRALWRRDMAWQSLGLAIASWGALYLLTWLIDPSDDRWWWWFFVTPPALGFATGLARPALQGLPLASAATVLATYALVMLAVGIWAVQCWDCSMGYDNPPRFFAFGLVAFWAGVVLALALIGIGFGVLITRYLPAAPEASAR